MVNDIFAALMFFTRLPWWRIRRVPADSFKRIVGYWPLAGWLTGGVTAGVFWAATELHLPLLLAVLSAFTARLLLTGALHEDGLADFFDGFGGGRSRDRILAIMKDSHIGTYGVLGLMLYVLLWLASVFVLADKFGQNVIIALFVGDVWSKWCASQIVNFLPYARKEDECKIKKIYARMSPAVFVTGLLFAAVPFAGYMLFTDHFPVTVLRLLTAAMAPVVTMLLLVAYMRRRLGGYTGDCCGALFLLCELSFLFILNGIWK